MVELSRWPRLVVEAAVIVFSDIDRIRNYSSVCAMEGKRDAVGTACGITMGQFSVNMAENGSHNRVS